MWRWIVGGAVTAVALLAILLVVRVAQTRKNDGQPPDPLSVAARVEDLLQLETAEYHYRDVIYFSAERRILGLRAGTQRALFAIEFRVIGGVDLTRGVEARLTEDNVLLLTLPPAQILLVDADENSIDQYFVEERFGRIDWFDISAEMESVKERIAADARERGILARAEANAQQILGRMLAPAGFGGVRVRFRAGEELRG